MTNHNGDPVPLRHATALALVYSSLLLSLVAPATARLNHTHAPHGSIQSRHHSGLLHGLARRDPGIPAQLPGSWVSQGCYTDSVGTRTFTGATFANTVAMTIESCISFCENNDFIYAGTEYSQECFCGNVIPTYSTAASLTDCSMACTGNANEVCGGPNRLNVFFHGGVTPPPQPVTNPGVGGWVSMGCYTDSTSARTLTTPVGTNGPTTVANCIAACEAGNYVLAGVEYSQECYCGNILSNGGAPAPDGTVGCNMPCQGNSSELCGGPNRLNLYQLNGNNPPTGSGWQSLGCYTDDVAARSLTVGQPIPASGNTIESCQLSCYNAGYPYAGVEYSNECYCDSQIRNGGGPAPDGNAQCNMPCSGNAGEMCGGPNRLGVYQFSGTLPPPTQNPPPGGGGGVVRVVTGLPGTWHYAGCYIDNTHGRILGTQQPDNNAVTVESCVGLCSSSGFTLAGLEFGVQCFCDNNVINGGTKDTSDAGCNMGCGGNSTEACGGPNRMSIYSSTNTVTELPVPVPQQSNLPGLWEYQGCIAENGAVRTFPYFIELKNNNTATNCLSLCAQYGYPAAGLEYSEQCFCGDVADLTTNGATTAPEADCSMACSGDPVHICGGPNRLSYYKWNGNLNTWHTPTNTGRYEFLIGGVVVPLITTFSTNNKVTFVEKFGSGPPNSTGAYELDLSLVNDFSRAWRTMHVKSDVFCSGSLTLPDKVGRQINMGGWSVNSLYGVRLYWPDGSPGVPGTNDWQENYDELKLQRGRWYPGAMVMANGSILIVGGEDGSNGPPVPSLEILPKPNGGDTVLTMDWLQRTDPNNLYPFLFVLPGGGILVIYYNEARILDERTFATTKVLPNLPGAVNDFTAGRTYPLEGTSVLLPQVAPYTSPVTVLTCGGSTLGPAIALDNCVSIQPEVAGAQWVIERMPSKRVMTCMVTLPDGTYLIMNGAQQGVAGFGLATDPNMNAILYDPSQPVGSRFSILGSTTIARMYHSEAILLQDGRILVSGSDPEDTRFPQEYRVEVYIPPYLSTGLTQPTFTVQNTDWAYNGAYPIVVTLHQGTTATMKVSLVAAVSSTHGNSMNQRILFPSFNCAGNTCTITAPPNAHICPPGWFQLFVLDGPTPSWSTWVRIGGDPAQLGNWPPFDDFSKPGL